MISIVEINLMVFVMGKILSTFKFQTVETSKPIKKVFSNLQKENKVS